jgi:hypothetical protein
MSDGHVSGKRAKIDWGSIKIRVVPADKDHPNDGNPYARLPQKEREKAIVSASAKIWVRHIRERQRDLEQLSLSGNGEKQL